MEKLLCYWNYTIPLIQLAFVIENFATCVMTDQAKSFVTGTWLITKSDNDKNDTQALSATGIPRI